MKGSDWDEEQNTKEYVPPSTTTTTTPKVCSKSTGPVVVQRGKTEVGGAHPLQNDVILNHLFKFCDSKLLAICRLVSKQWYQESLLTWRKDFPITFFFDFDGADDDRLFLKSRTSQSHTPLPEFLAYCEDPKSQCSTKPYRFIKIHRCEFRSNPEQFSELWNSLGPDLTTLHLLQCTFNVVEEFRKIVLTACPHLQTLKLDGCNFSRLMWGEEEPEYREPLYGIHPHLKSLQIRTISFSQSPVCPLPVSWVELFSHFQSLTDLSFRIELEGEGSASEWEEYSEDFFNSEFKNLTDAIRTVREQVPGALPFKCLEILPAPDLCGQATEDVQELHLPLNSLLIKLRFGMDNEDMDGVNSLLEFHAKTVKHIKLISLSPTASCELFPFGIQLDHLTTLKIREQHFDDMSFLNHTPNLESLYISGVEKMRFDNCCKVANAKVRMLHLEELRLEYHDNRFGLTLTDEDLASLFEWMPNLKSLHGLELNDKQFGMVCGGNWRNLRRLAVKGDQLTDVGVTGIENPDGEGEGGETGLGGDQNDDNDDAPKKEATRPNITNLQNLEEFGFESRLTGWSVFRGFLQLPRLRHIDYCSRPYGSLGYAASKALDAKKIVLRGRELLS